VAAPSSSSSAPVTSATCNSGLNFVVYNGTPPYNVIPSRGTAAPQNIPNSGGNTQITSLANGSGPGTVVFLDSSTPQQSLTAFFTCI
jgi:hypothetical protein